MFADRFKELRNSRGYNQKDIAKELNVSPSLVAGWESSNRDPDTEMLIKICSLLECSADYILGRTDIIKPLVSISREETELIERYRGLNDKQKGNIQGRMELFLDEK